MSNAKYNDKKDRDGNNFVKLDIAVKKGNGARARHAFVNKKFTKKKAY